MKYHFKWIAPLLSMIGLGSTASYAFPTLVNHGYTTCITCHASPSGGGLLNSYGKFVANELFSIWDDSTTALPWISKPETVKSLNAMFQGRVAQTYFETPYIKRGDFQKMQADLEVSYNRDSTFGVIALGPRLSSATSSQNQTDIFARRFYLGHSALNHAVRIGKFFPEFGINFPNHNVPTRKGLYFNHNEEPYIAQATLYSTTFDYTLAVLRGAANTELDGRNALSANIIYKEGTTRTGVSILKPQGVGYGASVHTQIGFLQHGYVISELGQKVKQESNSTSTSRVSFSELGWELTKGLYTYTGLQTTNNLTTQASTTLLPLGFKIYPLSHFELIVEAARTTFNSGGISLGTGSSGYVMLNTYF